MLDLRKPAGVFFILLGLLLVLAGTLFTFQAPLLTINLNLSFGAFCVIFGGVFLWLARRV